MTTLAALLVLALTPSASAQNALFDDDPPPQRSIRTAGSLGLGLGAGTSTAGFSAKYFARETLAVQGVVGAGYGAHANRSGWSTGLGLGTDLLFELPTFAALDDVEFGISAGPGAGVWIYDGRVDVAAAGVLGLEACLLVFPLDLVLEYRPRMMVAPTISFDWFSLSGHIRYYFDAKRR